MRGNTIHEMCGWQPADGKATGYATPLNPVYCLATFAADDGPAFQDPFLVYARGREKLFISFINGHFLSPRELPILGRAGRQVRDGAVAGLAVAGVVNSLNATLCAGGPAKPIAVLCADFDFETHELTYVTAGQYLLMMSADGAVRPLDAGGTPVGQDRGYTYFEETAHLAPGDMLIAYNHRFSLDFRAERMLEIAGEGMRARKHAVAIRDRVAGEWSQAGRGDSEECSASGLFFTMSTVPARAMMVRGCPTIWEAERKEFGADGQRPFRAQDLCFPGRTSALKVA